MLKYFCLVVLIMSSFGWTLEPIEFQNVIRYGNKKHKIKEVNYYVVNNDNKKELRRSVTFDYENQQVTSDESYLNGELNGKSFDYINGRLYEIRNYDDGNRFGRWYSQLNSDDSITVTTYLNGKRVSSKKIPNKRSLEFFKDKY